MSEPNSQQTTSSEAALEAARREKLRKIRELGIDPWGSRFDDHQPIGQIRAREGEITTEPADDSGHPPEQHGPKVRAAGRIVLRRPSGKVHWLQIRDWTGTIQVMIGKNQVGEENFALAQCLDLGDIIGVDGELKRTMKGELTIFVEDLKLLTKAIATPPEKHKGLADPELRQRMRYLDLIHTDGVLERFLRRTKIVQSIRNTLCRPRVRRDRRADAARDRRRGGRPAVYDPSQRPGYRPLPANRLGVAPEAAVGGRHRAGLRVGPRLSQRGHRRPAQPRVHHARSLPGLRQLRDDDGSDRGRDCRGDPRHDGR